MKTYDWEFQCNRSHAKRSFSLSNTNTTCNVVIGNEIVATAKDADLAQKIVDALNKADAS